MADPQTPQAPPSPQIEPETEPSGTAVATAPDELTQTLEKLGINSPQQLEGMATASKETGNMARMLGEVREELYETQAKLRQFTSQPPQQQYQSPETDMYNEVEDRPITMRELKSFYRDVTEANQKAQERSWAEWSSIQNDPRYPAFKERFEQTVSTPENQHALNTGRATLRTIYNNVVIDGLMSVITGMKDKIDQVPTTPETPPLNVESQNPGTPPVDITRTDQQEQLENITKNRTGTDDDVRKMLDVFLPAGDITKMRMRP